MSYRKGLLSAILIGTGCTFLYYSARMLERAILYHPAHAQHINRSELSKKYAMQELKFSTSQGSQTAFFIPAEINNNTESKLGKRTWVLFAGNAACSLDFAPLALRFLDDPSFKKCSFFFIDYPGYGLCEGKPSPESIYESSVAALSALHRNIYNNEKKYRLKLGFLAHSLGCSATLQLLSSIDINYRHIGSKNHHRYLVEKIILLAPFTSVAEMATQLLGRIPLLSYLLQHNFDNQYYIQKLRSKAKYQASIQDSSIDTEPRLLLARPLIVKIFHGSLDEIVPVEMGQTIANSFQTDDDQTSVYQTETDFLFDTEFIELPTSDHNSCLSDVCERILRFF